MGWFQVTRGFFADLFLAIRVAWLPTFTTVFHTPSLLFKPRELSRIFMSHVWSVYGDGVDQNSHKVKTELVTPRAKGIVLDIGAGHGHLINYLDKTQVTAYFALEPNLMMHKHIIDKAHAAGFREEDGTLLIIPCPLENINDICAHISQWSQRYITSDSGKIVPNQKSEKQEGHAQVQVIDSITCILTLCSVPSPTSTLQNIITHILRPGGQFLFYEHVRNPSRQIARLQDVVAPIWRIFFDGCLIGQDSVKIIEEAGQYKPGETLWSDSVVWGNEEEDKNSLFWHQVGYCLKKIDY